MSPLASARRFLIHLPRDARWPRRSQQYGGTGMPLALRICLLICLLHFVKGNTPPVFIGNPVFQIREDTLVGAIVFTVLAQDDDGDPIGYSLRGSEATRYFTINSATGVVTLKSTIDREEYATPAKNEQFTVEAVLTDGIYTVDRVLTILTVDVNDNFPEFKELPYQITLAEKKYVNEHFFRAIAEDKDGGNLGRVGYIMEVVPNISIFRIDANNGSLFINGELDYAENIVYQIKINASDKGDIPMSSAAILIVNVEDKPNLPPEFRNEIYQKNIMENSPVDTFVLSVTAVDGDKGINNQIEYELKGDMNGNFKINRATGEIQTAALIDRENTTYIQPGDTITFYVEASEVLSGDDTGPSTATATIIVTVMDVNDNEPTFYLKMADEPVGSINSTFNVHLPEESSPGSPISNLNMYIRDPDKRENGEVILSINTTVFEIVPSLIINEGPLTIRVKDASQLDYEEIQVLYVQVNATNGNFTTTAIVTINLVDINDNSPLFSAQEFYVNVSEGASDGDFIHIINATDKDSGRFAEISFSLSGATDVRDTFQVDNVTGALSVRDKRQLDRETKPVFYANVIAMDGGGRVSSVPLQINVLDVNDNIPRFQQMTYTAFYKENMVNDPILILATDKDEEGTQNSNITYSIFGGDDFSNFTIDATSGVLIVSGHLDAESMDPSLNGTFRLTVMAEDQGNPPLNSTVSVVVKVEDLNDETPVFTKPVYTASVPENAIAGHFVVSVHAPDSDVSPPNNRVSYSIFSGSRGNFLIRAVPIAVGSLDFIGNISVDSGNQLDYEADKIYTMVIVATDLGFPERSSSTTVTVLITDVNDETPEITNLPRSVNAFENGRPGAMVVNVTGFDKDTDADLKFFISDHFCYKGVISVNKSECARWFVINVTSGTVSYGDIEVDFEEITRVELTVVLIDLATVKSRNSTSGVLTINILDANDNDPIFQIKPSTGVIVAEIANDKYVFPEIWQATDRDEGENAKLRFSVTRLQLVQSNNITVEQDVNTFSMETQASDNTNQYTGSMGITRAINPAQDGRYIITVTVSDNGSPQRRTSTDFTAFLISETNKVKLDFDGSVQDIEAKKGQISINLQKTVYNSIVAITAIKAASTKQTREGNDKSVMEVYFYFSNGTAVSQERAVKVIQDSVGTEAVQKLIGLGMTGVGSGPTFEDPNIAQLRLLEILVISLAVVLLLILTVMITITVCMRRSYQRKLKSMTAMNRAKEVKSAPAQNGTQVPGTNMHATEKSNPLWNSPVYELPDLGYIEESDPDRKSINSLDENVLDASDLRMEETEMNVKAPPTNHSHKNGESAHQNLLGVALQQRENDRSARDMKLPNLQGADNKALDTTDI
ncbi:cadherin-related family member 2 isoform X2 [Petromyzon marinus]|uniref:cadherin-related family member 2 isoform X2 n=1 Tax=Petromyzon marinus TaxID=7757 RepID=UPI003F70D631